MLRKALIGFAAAGLLLANTGANAATDRAASISGPSENLTDEETGTYVLLAVVAGVVLLSILDNDTSSGLDLPESP